MKARLSILVLAGVLALFILGLWQLFRMRFESGDVFAPYSSLRTDPLGTMAFYESLQELSWISVARDLSDQNRLPETPQTAYLHLGARSYDWTRLPEDLFQEAEGFVLRGGRLVVTFYPEAVPNFRSRRTPPPATPAAAPPTNTPPIATPPTPPKSSPPTKTQPPDPDEELRTIALSDRWGVELTHVALTPGEDGTYQPVWVQNRSEYQLPDELAWHSGIIFTNLGPAWRIIYARGSDPVLLERKFGAGSIVMAADSYFLSNQALREEPQPDLLAWLVSPATRVVFDEAHHGIVEYQGVAGLMRKYGLEAVVGMLLLLTALFIWKNSMSFVPPSTPDLPPGFIAGKDAAAGFVNLLRRNIAPVDLLGICFAEWTRSLTKRGSHLVARVDRAQELIEAENARPPRTRNPVAAYVEICRVLKGERGTLPDETPAATSSNQKANTTI